MPKAYRSPPQSASLPPFAGSGCREARRHRGKGTGNAISNPPRTDQPRPWPDAYGEHDDHPAEFHLVALVLADDAQLPAPRFDCLRASSNRNRHVTIRCEAKIPAYCNDCRARYEGGEGMTAEHELVPLAVAA